MNHARRLFTWLNLHFLVLALLIGFNVVLGAKLLLAWHAIGSDQSNSYEQQHLTYVELQSQMGHLAGLPDKVEKARAGADQFYEQRIAPNYSTVLAELGTLTSKENVRLSRATYVPSPAIDGLTEVRIEASLSGEYTPLMRFINDLERDKHHVFFIIDGLTFTGQQGGLVNLRLRLTTYLRSSAQDLPAPPPPENQAETPAQTKTVAALEAR